jgi:hypothetical protein
MMRLLGDARFAVPLAVALIVLSGSANAVDVIVNVPVHLKYLPEGASPAVGCDAMKRGADRDSDVWLGGNSTPIPPFTDEFDGKVVVEITFPPDSNADPEAADFVTCYLTFSRDMPSVRSYEDCQGGVFDPDRTPMVCAPHGATVRGEVTQDVAETLPE